MSAEWNVESVAFFLRRGDYNEKYPLQYAGRKGEYDEFFLDLRIDRAGTYFYRFELYHRGGGVTYVGKGPDGGAIAGEWLPEWILNTYSYEYTTPDSFKGGVVYHIFVDRFCKKGDVVPPKFGVLKDWGEDVTVVDPDGVFRANDFFGGNFAGIISKLDYLESLGVTTLYLSPIFKSSSNHRYDTGDYMKIDETLGTEEDFRALVEESKKRGIGVMLDGVFNHTGADSKYFNKFGHYKTLGAYQSKDSKYYDWYTFYDYPDDYHCWWGITVVPTVNRDCEEFHELIAGSRGVLNKWTDFGVKGWRLDVVDELADNFIKTIRHRIKANDKDCVVIGEVWEDASLKYSYGEEREYFRGVELDGVMNYVFKDAILDFLTGGPGEEFADKIMEIVENYPKISLDCCMTLIDSHDTIRAVNYLSGVDLSDRTKEERRDYRLTKEEYERGKRLLLLASALQYFLPGVPSVYYGDEVGMEGFEDPINRRPFPWDDMDEEILSHYRLLGGLRKEHKEAFLQPVRVYGEGSKVRIERDAVTLDVDRETGEWSYDFSGEDDEFLKIADGIFKKYDKAFRTFAEH
ncbi:MAG: glycoside hydrolase family 13 protein [Clostridia bacterium]|nr:glycoside hydrolase family 13 protein [Clostridia bacterium]